MECVVGTREVDDVVCIGGGVSSELAGVCFLVEVIGGGAKVSAGAMSRRASTWLVLRARGFSELVWKAVVCGRWGKVFDSMEKLHYGNKYVHCRFNVAVNMDTISLQTGTKVL